MATNRLTSFVEYYRLNNKPLYQRGAGLVFTCTSSQHNISLLKAIESDGFEVEEILQGDNCFDIDDLIPSAETLEVTLTIPTDGTFHVYSTLEEMLEHAPSLSNGEYINEYYVTNDDYYSLEATTPSKQYSNLINICSMIKGLGELAHYHDTKVHGSKHNFVYIDDSELVTSKPVVIQPNITIDLLNLPLLDVSLVESFYNVNTKVTPNLGREKGIFRISVIEFLGEKKNLSEIESFSYLVSNWTSFLNMYQRNFETYMSGFAFHQARKEVAEAEFTIAEQYSKVMSDIAGKLFGLPVSFVAILGLFNIDSKIPSEIIILLGLTTVSWLMSKLVLNQKRQLERIKHAKKISFDTLEGERTEYPLDLQTKLDEATTALDEDYSRLNKLFNKLDVVVWLPTSIAAVILACRYSEQVLELIDALGTLIKVNPN